MDIEHAQREAPDHAGPAPATFVADDRSASCA
jgi:hypothetical protein